VVDFYADGANSDYLERIREELHPEFIKDLMVKAMDMRDVEPHMSHDLRSVCYYHEHDDYEVVRCKKSALRLD